MNLSQVDINYLIDAVDAASNKVMGIYRTDFRVSFKQDKSVLTNADLASNQILITALKRRWPHVQILSEESEFSETLSQVSSYWALDPLDGSKEFINGNGEFTINLALIIDGEAKFGIVAAPAFEVLWVGYPNHPYQARLRKNNTWSTLNRLNSKLDWTSQHYPLKVAVSRSHPSEILKDWLKKFPHHSLTKLGSSLKICLIAEGQLDCYPRFGRTSIWDIAAAHAVLKAVGGDIWPWPYNNERAMTYSVSESLFNPFFIAAAVCPDID